VKLRLVKSTTFGLHRAKLFNSDGVATLFEDRVRTWSEVADRVARLAGALRELGACKGDRVAILMLKAVHAVVMRRPGAEVSADDIIQFCRARIAHYKCPRSVKVQDEMLPLCGAGKILKRELRKPYWEGKTRQVN
jgi:acyl-CoA synthetase (AMP-forming)/AMP-acid ligase II